MPPNSLEGNLAVHVTFVILACVIPACINFKLRFWRCGFGCRVDSFLPINAPNNIHPIKLVLNESTLLGDFEFPEQPNKDLVEARCAAVGVDHSDKLVLKRIPLY